MPQNPLSAQCIADLDIDFQTSSFDVCVSKSSEYYSLALTSDVHDLLKARFVKKLNQISTDISSGNLELRDYYPGSRPGAHEIEALSVIPIKHDIIIKYFENLELYRGMTYYSPEEGRPEIMISRFEDRAHNPVYIVRKIVPKMFLDHGFTVKAVFKNQYYNLLEEPILIFDEAIHCIVKNSNVYIFNQDLFQSMFDYYNDAQGYTSFALDKINSVVPIHGFDEFKLVCQGHSLKMLKIRNLINKPYWAKITMDDIKRTIDVFGLPIRIINVSGTDMVQYDSSDKWSLLRLFDDDYLDSVMTAEKYEATGKRKHTT